MEFNGDGNFTIVLNLTSDTYAIDYDGSNCSLNPNCIVNNNSGGIINLTLSLGSYHYLGVYHYSAASPSSEEGTTLSGGGNPTYYPAESDLQEGYLKSLGRLWSVRFEHESEFHQLKVDSFYVNNKSATITISSEPQTKILSFGEEWKVNLNDDTYYDLMVRLDNVTYSRINIFVQKINESIFVDEIEEVVVEDKIEVVKKGYFSKISCWFYICVGIILVLVLIGFGVFVGMKGFGKRKGR